MKNLNLLLITTLPIIFFLGSSVLSAKNVTNDDKKVYIDEQIRFADGLIQRKHYTLAIDEYKRLINKFPNSELVAEAWLQLAEAYAAKKDFKNSFATFDQFFSKFPNIRITPAAKLRYALILNKTTEKNKQSAVKILNQLKTDKKTPEIIVEASIFHLGKLYLKNNDKKKAEQEFKIIASKKVSKESHNFRAFAAIELAQMKPLNEAVALLMPISESTSLPPEISKTVLWKLANLLYDKQEFDKAATLFAKASILFPDTVYGQESRFRRLECLYRMKDFDKVITDINLLLKNKQVTGNKSIERLLYMKALTLKHLKFYNQAIKTLQTILKSAKNKQITPLAHYSYIECLLLDNKTNLAIKQTEKYISQNKLPSEKLKDIVILLINSSGNDTQFIPLLKTAIAKCIKNSESETAMQLKLASLLLKQNKYSDVEKICKQQSEKGYESLRPYACMMLAQIFELQNKNKKALAEYQRIIKKYPDTPIYPNAMLRVAILLLQNKKQWETAKLYLSQIVTRFPDHPLAHSANFYTAYIMFYEKQYIVAESILRSIEKNKNISNDSMSDIQIYLIWIYLKTNQLDKAMAIINKKKSVNIWKRSPAQFLIELGDKTATKHSEVSEKAFTQLSTFNDQKDRQRALLGIANAQINLGDPVKAIQTLKKAAKLKADPALRSSIQNKLGHLLFERGKNDEAVMIYEKCLENPADKKASAQARLGLAKILSQDKERLKTANRYAMSVFILSSDKEICSEAMLLSMKISMDMGNKKEAKSTWKEFSNRFPDLAKKKQAINLKNTLNNMQ